MEAQFERVTGYKLVGLGACTEWIRAGTYYHWVIAQRGQLGRCPRLAGIPPPEGPMTPPPYPPVTAAASSATRPGSTGSPASNCSPASDGGDLHTGYRSKTPTGRGQTTPIKVPALKKGCRCAGVQGAARDTGGAGDSSGRSGRATSREPRTARSRSKKRRRSQSRKGIRGRRLRSPSRIMKADFRPSKRYMRRPANINWPLK